MTNPTLERAARALAAEDGKRFSGRSLYDRNSEIYINLTRAVLMAVRLQTTDGEDYVTSMDEVMFNERLDAILAEGE